MTSCSSGGGDQVAVPATVLVYVGLDLVGDGVMKLPFAAALRAAYPAARITWLAGHGKTVFASSLAPLVQGLIDEVLEDAGIGVAFTELLRRPLTGRRFDLIIDSQRRVLTSLILRRIRHRRFISAAAGWRLSDAVPTSGRSKRPSMIGQMFALLEAALGERPPSPPALQLPGALAIEAERRLPSGPHYVGLAPGAGGKHKCWPLDRFIALAAHLSERGWQPVFLLGPAERGWEADIRTASPSALLPLADQDTPAMTIALASRLSGAIANDSGTGHMLAAAGVPLVSLFGPTAPEKFAPSAARLRVVRAQDHGGPEMAAIPLESVLDAFGQLITAS